MAKSKNNTTSTEETQARKDVDFFIDDCKISWPSLIKKIHETIGTLELNHVEPITYNKGWQRMINGTIGKRKGDIFWWKEFLTVTTEIKKGLGATGVIKESTLHEILKNRSPRIQDKILYGYFKNQDTIIPKFFESSYKQKLPNIEFIPFEDWNEGLEAFARNKIHVALRDFPTTIAYNSLLGVDSPLFFWPFFSFNGYYIFIKVSALKEFFKKEGLEKKSFRELNPIERKRFLENQQFIVEKNTDFEWVLKKFCENNGCGMEVIQDRITYMNTRLAKLEFKANKKYSIYCTNPAHTIDMDGKKEFELIPQNTSINHKNFNGLICKEEYYNANKIVIERLIKIWFDNISPFTTEIKILAHPPSHRPENYKPSYTVKNLINELSQETHSVIGIDDLPVLYEHSNIFYDAAGIAFDEFYNKVLTDKIAIQNYCEIAQIQLDRKTNDMEKVKKVIAAIKTNMIQL